MQKIFFYKIDVPGPLLGKGALWFDSCKRPPPVSDHSVFAFEWSLTGGSTVIHFARTALKSSFWYPMNLLVILCNFSFSVFNLKCKFVPKNFTCLLDNHKIN